MQHTKDNYQKILGISTIPTNFSYYEYKYLVTHENLYRIRNILDTMCGNSDPFPYGIVDSIYFDSLDEKLKDQCLNGEYFKCKFRIRGYGDNKYVQIHQKIKEMSSVKKFKEKIIPIQIEKNNFPSWEEIKPLKKNSTVFDIIHNNSLSYNYLFPSIRVKYKRFRYRLYDYRLTLDTDIEVSSSVNGLSHLKKCILLPNHVLEIKTTQTRPNLPFLGIIRLPQISYSKFLMGLQQLN